LKRCKEVNEDLQLGSFDIEKGSLSTTILQSAPIRVVKPRTFTSELVKEFIEKEQNKVSSRNDSKAAWKKTVSDLCYTIGDVASKLKPIIDLFMPQSMEYTVPYGCLMIIFQVCLRDPQKGMHLLITVRELQPRKKRKMQPTLFSDPFLTTCPYSTFTKTCFRRRK
jgi:hypothetical protein